MLLKDARIIARETQLIELVGAILDVDFDYGRTDDKTVYAKEKAKHDRYLTLSKKMTEEDNKTAERINTLPADKLNDREKLLYAFSRLKGFKEYKEYFGDSSVATIVYASRYKLTKFEASKIAFSIAIINSSLASINQHYVSQGMRHPRIVLDINDTEYSEGVKCNSSFLQRILHKLSLYIKEYISLFTYRSKAIEHLKYNLGYVRLEEDELHIANFLIKL